MQHTEALKVQKIIQVCIKACLSNISPNSETQILT